MAAKAKLTLVGLTVTRTRKVRIRRIEAGAWAWTCTLCHPTCRGITKRHATTLAHVANHLKRQRWHHEWVLQAKGSTFQELPTVTLDVSNLIMQMDKEKY